MAIFLNPGTRINTYTIAAMLSSGGEGTVYRAKRPDGTDVALKQFNFSVSDKRNRGLYERVTRHELLIGQLNARVAEIQEVFVFDDLAYEVCEFVDGKSLAEVLASRGRLPVREAIQVLDDLLEGLGWLHTQSIVHRDIKPGNFVVCKARGKLGHGKIIDLGIALFLDKPRLTIGTGPGTYAYAPPEFFNGAIDRIDGRSDLYSVGVTLFETIAGRLPYPDDSLAELFKRVLTSDRPSLRSLAKDTPPALEAIIDTLMHPEQDRRYRSAQHARVALRNCLPTLFPEGARRRKVPEPGVTEEADAFHATHVPALQIQTGRLAARKVVIPDVGLCLGRSMLDPCDERISRFHARAEPRKDGLVVVDLDTPNGLIYRGERCRKIRLSLGETVVLGATPLVYVLD